MSLPSAPSTHGTLAHLLPPSIQADVARWLAEDCPSFDIGGFVVGDSTREARLLGKSPGLLAGAPFVDEVFRQLGCTVTWHAADGAAVAGFGSATEGKIPAPITHVATVRGPVRCLLLGERVALNTLARCSGVATQTAKTRALLEAALPAGETGPRLAGTRKTTPGFRLVEKYGMRVGGADPHRHDLSQMVMLKDNHVWACGSIAKAVAAAKSAAGFSVKVEVEVRTEAEAEEAIAAGAEVVMLDNFAPDAAAACVQRLRQKFGRAGFLLEISGGLTERNLGAYARAGVDVLSTSSIHQGVGHVDFSLKIVH